MLGEAEALVCFIVNGLMRKSAYSFLDGIYQVVLLQAIMLKDTCLGFKDLCEIV